jgi:uncharacterized protein YkwD
MKSTMFLLPLILALFTSCMKEQANFQPRSKEPVSLAVNKTVLLQLVNDARKKGCNCGDTYYDAVPPLSWNDQLEKAALAHSSDMNQNKYFSHIGQDGSNAGDRILNAGYSWKFYGENIAEGYKTEQEVVEGWLSSPGHCRNIMNKSYKEMGVARTGDYWTQAFGSK